MGQTVVTASQLTFLELKVACEKCGHTYRCSYELKTEASSSFSNPFLGAGLDELNARARASARAEAERKAGNSIQALRAGDFSEVQDQMRPCPNCGYWQSWMVLARQKHHRTYATGLTVVAGLACAVFAILVLVNPTQPLFLGTGLVIGLSLIGALWQSVKSCVNPNARRDGTDDSPGHASEPRPPLEVRIFGHAGAERGPSGAQERRGEPTRFLYKRVGPDGKRDTTLSLKDADEWSKTGPLSPQQVEEWVKVGRLTGHDLLIPVGTTVLFTVREWMAGECPPAYR